MKTIALSMILGLSLIACKKDNHEMTLPKEGPYSLLVNKPVKKVSDYSKIHEWKSEEISSKLKNKANDTLYITNFFATWCGPCMDEIPHFIDKMKELSGQPVKFTFISIDDKEDWTTKVYEVADDYDLAQNIVLLNKKLLKPDFFKNTFKTWDGKTVPFTLMTKGDHTEEYSGMIKKQELDSRISKILSINTSAKAYK